MTSLLPKIKVTSLLPLTLFITVTILSPAVRSEGYWTYSPSLEAMSGILGMKNPGPGEDNLFLIPERNSFKMGNVTVYSCKICDHRGVDPQEYVRHVKEKHFFPGHEKDHQWIIDLGKRQDYNYSCRVCNETYKTEMALLWHLTKMDHIVQGEDDNLARYLRARLQLNDTYGRKKIYHGLARPFYKIKEPKNVSWGDSEMLDDLCEGYKKATFIPGVDLSSGDISNDFEGKDVIKTGFSKYQKSDFEKRLKKVNGVNVYQRSPEVEAVVMTDETAEEARQAAALERIEERRAAKRQWEEMDTDELQRQEEEEAKEDHSASYYRRQLDEYGPLASHSDKLGDRKVKKKTTIIYITKPDVNRKDPWLQ
ncbi:hypothetical protein M8J75_008329 [Diaphorina citri]|nr:hypothetical protein M8J75_008329 [Diaphorina citri]KAI5728169.1 hypothetical protein M8J77_012424 [Diaphorina citri]